MSEGTSSETKQFILPFSTLSENRKEPFTSDIEAAAVFSLAELERAKGGGLIMKQPEEKIEFIAKVGYPLLLSPSSETALIFDGLGRSSYTLPYAAIPDVKVFLENMRRGSKTCETHLAFLRDNINYFQASPPEKGLPVSGLIREPGFLLEFDAYRHEAEDVEGMAANVALLTATLDSSLTTSAIRELEDLYAFFEEETASLYRCMKFLNKATRQYVRELHGKAHAVREEFASKIAAEEEIVAPKIERLKDDYDVQMADLTKRFEKQRHPVQKEKVKLEKAREHALDRIEHYKLEAKTHAENDDSAGEQKWREKANKTKKELSEIEEQLKQTEKERKTLEERRSLEIFKLRDELEAKIKEARVNLVELEASRDAKILIHRQEIDKLEKQTKLICDQIGRMVKLREANSAQFRKLGVKKELGWEGTGLYYVPFYVTCYGTETRKRYFILPPSEANSIGILTRLKGALGMAKIKRLLAPRFEVVSSLMDTVQMLAQQNVVFETEIKESGARVNLLTLAGMNEEVQKGLEYLKNEGWLSEKEYDAIRQRLN